MLSIYENNNKKHKLNEFFLLKVDNFKYLKRCKRTCNEMKKQNSVRTTYHYFFLTSFFSQF